MRAGHGLRSRQGLSQWHLSEHWGMRYAYPHSFPYLSSIHCAHIHTDFGAHCGAHKQPYRGADHCTHGRADGDAHRCTQRCSDGRTDGSTDASADAAANRRADCCAHRPAQRRTDCIPLHRPDLDSHFPT